MANPVQKVVMPTTTATSLTCHSSDICLEGGEYDPAVYAVMRVATQDSHMVKLFRLSDHSKGEVNSLRSGWAGAGRAEGLLDFLIEGIGIGVSNVR